MEWSAEDVSKHNIQQSMVGSKVFAPDTLPVIHQDISHLKKNAGSGVQKIIKGSCAGNVYGIGNQNKRLLIDFVQYQYDRFYRSPVKSPELWVQRVDAALRHLADDHTKCDPEECNDDKRKGQKPICHQLLTPTRTFKQAKEKFDKLINGLREVMLGRSKINPKNMPEVMTLLGTTSKIESSHARIINRELLRKGAPINILSNTVEARLAIGSIIQNVGMDGLLRKVLPWTTDKNRQLYVAQVTKAAKRSRADKPKRLEKLKKKRKSYAMFSSNPKVKALPTYKKDK